MRRPVATLTKVSVQTCAKRIDGLYLITYVGPGRATYMAVSRFKVEPGSDVRVLDGKVIP